MAKLKNDSISKDDFIEYLNSYSDFDFELQVLKQLRQQSVECEHGGHYIDPVTGKSRQFDIRATKTITRSQVGLPQSTVHMAIECKNIRENFPLLISCTPRTQQESYHAVLKVQKPEKYAALNVTPDAETHIFKNQNSLYPSNDPVGKSTAQVGRTERDEISANDSDFYEKWTQCLSSMNDLTRRIEQDYTQSCFAAFPFLVVPNNRLWRVTYDSDGNRMNPTQTDRVSCFINKKYSLGSDKPSISISHLEIVTLKGLDDFIREFLNADDKMDKIFRYGYPADEIKKV